MSIDPLTLAPQLMAPTGDLDPEALKRMKEDEAAEAFEGYFVELMIKEMRKTVPEGMLTSGPAAMFTNMLDQEIAKRIADCGGLGLGDAILGQISTGGERKPAPVVAASSPDVRALGGPRDRRAQGENKAAEPLPVEGVLTSRFGHRRDPFHGRTRAHKGIDIAADMGAPIQAVRPGRVQVAEERDGFGRVVVIEHDDGLSTLYAHCDELKVAEGQQVSRGDEIATVGDTGRTTGPHLHFEARKEGVSQDPLRLFGWNEVLGQ